MKIELNEAETEQLAVHIEILKVGLNLIDFEYLQLVSKEFKKRVSLRESAGFIVPSFSSPQNDWNREQSHAMECLITLILSLKRCDELKSKVSSEQQQRDRISKMFEL